MCCKSIKAISAFGVVKCKLIIMKCPSALFNEIQDLVSSIDDIMGGGSIAG